MESILLEESCFCCNCKSNSVGSGDVPGDAINKIYENEEKIGDTSLLDTEAKESLVSAINELKNQPFNDKLFGKGSGVGSIQQIGEESDSEASGDWSFAAGGGSARGNESTSLSGGVAEGEHAFAACLGYAVGKRSVSNLFFCTPLSITKIGDKTYKTNSKSDGGYKYVFSKGGYIINTSDVRKVIAKIVSTYAADDGYHVIVTDRELESLSNLAIRSVALGDFSISLGGLVYGDKSFASYYGIAVGPYSVALGRQCASVGQCSFTTNYDSIAQGDYSFACGGQTKAIGSISYAEGLGTKAIGDKSHAEGTYAQAIGAGSHAEGQYTEARGVISHAQGNGTIAENRTEHAQGSYNLSHKASTTNGDKGNTHSSIGIGWDSVRKNAQEVMQNGDFYVLGVGGYDGTNPNTEGIRTIQEVVNELYDDYKTALNLI